MLWHPAIRRRGRFGMLLTRRSLPGVVIALSLGLSLAVPMAGCRGSERLAGSVIGGITGITIGGSAGGVGGAVLGGALGTAGGYLIGDYFAKGRGGRATPPPTRPSPTQAPAVPATGSRPASHVRAAPSLGARAKAAYDAGRRAGTAPEARAHYRRSIELDPTHPEPYNAIGLSYLHAGDYVQARRGFEMALERDPNHYAAQHNLARLEANLRRAR